jgi:CubicO group peptidase (beta-lactamase class C family)
MAYHCQTTEYACSFGMSSEELASRTDQLRQQHYLPAYMVSYAPASGIAYAAIWLCDQRTSLSHLAPGLAPSDYQTQFDALNAQGYKLLCVSAAAGNALEYSGLWQDGGWKGFSMRFDLSATEYQAEFDQHQQDGYNLIWVEGYSNGSASRYAAIWSKFASSDRHARHNLPIEDYQGVFDEYKAIGYRIAHFSAHHVGSQTFVAAIWIKEDGYEPHARHNMTECELQNELERQAWNDRRPTCITGYVYKGATRYAGVWVRTARTSVHLGTTGTGLEGFDTGLAQLMSDFGITAATMAVAYKGRLVLARGFSRIADRDEPIPPTGLFRIASVSKAFTGAAIVKLIEQGKLRFDDKLLDLLGWEDAVHDALLKDVTVDHLLHHAGGWDRSKSPVADPMFDDTRIADELNISLPVTQESIFRWMTTKYDLDFPPGSDTEYSNYGYMLLGMIIERVAGTRYEDFVRENLLLPLGIRRMRLGPSLFSDRLPSEVTYQQRHANLYADVMVEGAPKEVLQTYGNYNFANLAAHGGWVASAVDLVKFASCFDDPAACSILSASSIQTMFTRPYPPTPIPTKAYFACGWDAVPGSPGETYRTGSFNGTEALMYRRSDGIDAAVVVNRLVNTLVLPCPDDPPLPADLDVPNWPGLLASVRTWIAGVRSWPTVDMWSEYF